MDAERHNGAGADGEVRQTRAPGRAMSGLARSFVLLLSFAGSLLGAADANALACTSAATGNWNAAATWAAPCNIAGGPVAADTVTIAAAHTVTVTANAAATSITIAAPSVAAHGININPGIALNVSGAISMTAPAVNGRTSTLAVGSGTLTAASIAINSGNGSKVSRVTVSTGTITVTGNISFAGTAANAQFASTGASMTNVGGNFTPGALTAGAGMGTINFNGGAAQSMGAFATYNNVTVNKAAGTVTMAGNATLAGALTVTSGTLAKNTRTLGVAGNLVVNGAITGTTGNITLSGAAATIDGTGSITTTTGLLSITAAKSILATANLTIASPITITGAITVTNNGTVNKTTTTAINGSVAGSTWLNAANSTLNYAGTNAPMATGVLNAAAVPNTVKYTGAAQTAKVTTYNNLTLSGSLAKTFATTPTVNGVLSMEGTATVVVTTGVVTYGPAATLQYNTATARAVTSEEWATPFAATGGVIIANTGAITLDTAKVLGASVPLTINSGATLANGAFALSVAGNFTQNGTFTAGAGVFTLNGGAAVQTLSGTGPLGFANLTVNNTGGITLARNVTVTSAIIGAVTLTNTCPTDYTLTSNGGATVAHSCPVPVTVTSINTADANPTSAATVSWTVVFNQSVTGVDATAFTLAASGVSGAYITSVTGSGTTWTVTANTGIGAGTLGLNQTGPGAVVPTLTGTFTGQVYTVTATPALAEYRMDEAVWNGTANEVIDSGTGGFNGTAVGLVTLPTTSNTSPAIAGSPGTCRYGVFSRSNKDYLALPGGFPNLAAAAGDFTITAWINVTDNTLPGQRIFIDDQSDSSPGSWGFSVGETTAFGAGGLRFYYRQPTVYILDTVAIPSNQWLFVALSVRLVAGANASSATIYAWNTAGTLLTSNTGTFTWTAGSDPGPSSIGGETNASGEGTNAFGFGGSLDEVRVYQKALSQAALAAIATQTHACPVSVPDHIRIEHDGGAISCSAEAVVVKACSNADCSILYTGGVTGNLTAGTNSVAFSIPNGSSQTTAYIHLPSNSAAADPQTVRLGASSVSPVPTDAGSPYCSISAGAPDNTTACDVSVYKAGFLFDVPHLTSATASGTVNVSAVRSSDSSTCVPLFQNVTRTVAFWGEYQNPASGTLPLQVNGGNIETTAAPAYTSTYPLAFGASGVATLTSVRYDDVGLMQLNARYVGSTANTPPDGGMVVLGSDTFVVKPDHFDLSAIQQTAAPNLANPAAADAAGNRFVMAGEQFSVTVTARNALGNATPNYGQETAAESVKLTSALVAGLGLSNNPAVGGTFGAFSNGVATGTAFTWNEAGIITLTPGVADADYLGAGDITGTASGNVGRFHAAKFALSGGVIANRTGLAGCPAPAGCGTFTYMGEQMSAVFNLTAKAVDGTTTLQNYNYSATPANNFAKLDPTATGNPLVLAAVDTGTPRTVATLDTTTYGVAGGSFAGGVATVTVPFAVTRGGSAYGPFDALDVGVNPADGDGAALAVLDLAVNAGGAPNTHGLVASTKARYGRMKLSNAHGSELLPLAINVAAQYWNGTTYVTNILDNDSVFAATDVVFGNYTKNLNAANYPNSGATVVTPVSVVFVNGAASYKLAKPGAGNNGSVDMTVSALSAYLPGNTARATFGVYKGNNEFIYLREAY